MTPTLRCLVLLTAFSASSACSDAPSAPTHTTHHTPKSSTSKAKTTAERALPKATQLVSTTPAMPPSLLDDRGVAKESGHDAAVLHAESTEASEPAPVDFDRALDPSEVQVNRFVLASDVRGREPVGETDTFTTETAKIYAFVQLANDKEPYAFRVHWEKAEEPASAYGVKLSVPTAPRWRTWSWTAIRREPGEYRAVLRTLSGEEITSRPFLIEPAGEDAEE